MQRVVYFKLIVFIGIVLILAGLQFFNWKIQKERQTAAAATPTVQSVSTPPPQFTDFHLLIPSLNISVPIIADIDGNNKDAYFKALESGVAHYKGTAKPGESGNIFIFGHSSFYFWSPGNYKEIFKNLEDIKKDDEIIIWWQGKEYKYRVTKIETVDPTEVSVLKPTTSEQVTLMTCVPPGTTLKRLIVVAKPE